MLVPCRDCPRQGCGTYHSQCKEYLDFQKRQQEAYKQRKINVSNSHKLKREI